MKIMYYILFNCDEWKSHSSMSLIGVFTASELQKVIKRKVKKGDFEFNTNIEKIKDMSNREIDIALTYGYTYEVSINEVLE